MEARFIVVDYVDHHAVADTAVPPERDEAGELVDPTQDCDHGTVVWRGEPHDRKDLDAQHASARVAEAACKEANEAAALIRPRSAPPSLELDADGNLPASTAEVAPAPSAQSRVLDTAHAEVQAISPADVGSVADVLGGGE